jgi:hypothetical protein
VYLSAKTNPDINPRTEPKIICINAPYHNTKVLFNKRDFNAVISFDEKSAESFKRTLDSIAGIKTSICNGTNIKAKIIVPATAPVNIPLGVVIILNVLQLSDTKL